MEAITIRDRVAFALIRAGFKIAMKGNSRCQRFYYQHCGDTYTFESAIGKLMKTTEKGSGD